MRRKRREAEPQPKQIRCAIYTRKSTEEGLQQDFNSLDAQRDSAEKYIASQAGEGWVCLPDQYDDGGFTGGNMDRPALQRLLADVDAGKIDCIVVYKVDRLSRSILDFAKIMERFDQRGVSFVSVTQHFNTTNSMGRLTLNILLSFAQFEREIISERTRDKIAAARRRGKWMGGKPLLGYDLLVTPGGGKLVVNDHEAARVRAIFELYLEHERIAPVLQELDRRAWRTKQWTTRRTGMMVGGRPFDKVTLFRLLTNPAYLGKVRHRDDLFDGEHDAIVDEAIWQRARAMLQRNGRTGGGVVKNKYGALLKGLLRCVPCDCAMVHSTSSKGPKRYRYYVCTKAMKRGWYTCPSKSVPAGELERFVVDQIRSIGRDPGVLAETVRQVRVQSQKAIADLERERGTLERDLARQNKALKQHLTTLGSNGSDVARQQDELRRLETRLTEVRERHVVLTRELVDEREVVRALSLFDPVWESLTPREQARIVQLLVERVDYDGKTGSVAVTFRPTGIKALAEKAEEDAA
ncbi:MAG: hypothetical protein BroJett003_06120 [Planctomycetota bacterium]|nr:MAG: hypothetical protein BroJett003_06120 [Planctomycetota bacterium]